MVKGLYSCVYLSFNYVIIHAISHIITTAHPIPYTAKFMFDGVRNKKLNK